MDKPRSPNHRRLQQRKRWALALAAPALLASAIVLFGLHRPAGPSVPRSSILLATVKQGALTVSVQASGRLAPRVEQWITAPSPGVVKTCFVRPGDVVEPNTVLVQLRNPDLIRRIEQAHSDEIAADAKLASLQAQLKGQMLDLENELSLDRSQYQVVRLRQLAQAQVVKEHIISELDYQEIVAQTHQLQQRVNSDGERITLFRASLQAQLHAARIELLQLKATLLARQRDLANLNVTADMRGIVQQVVVQDGQRLDIGGNIARITEQNNLIAQLQVPEAQASSITLGQLVDLDTYGSTATHLAGRVLRVNPTVQEGTVEVDVAPIGRVPGDLRSGLDVQGNIMLAKLPNATYIARPAGAEAGSTLSLFRLLSNGRTAVRTKVHIGLVSANAVQVIQGLTPGDRVIVSDTSEWNTARQITLSTQ